MKNKKGFTLIELLAVIIILGILMIIAIPSVTQYINNSRKSAYVDTAKEIISGARNMVNKGDLEMFSTEITYYIPASMIGTENGLKSPYGDFTEAYVAVTYDGHGYNYYWISVDETGQGVKNITRLDKLDEDDIESDIIVSDITSTVNNTGIGGRKIVNVLQNNNTWDTVTENAKNNVSEDGGESIPLVQPVCKAVTDTNKLHTEECTITSNNGCKAAGYYAEGSKGTSTITYGTIVSGNFKSGDAFDCDVNADGTYDYLTERFYYVTSDGDNSILIYYNDVSGGNPLTTYTAYAYDFTNKKNWHGPVTAYEQLPSTTQWKHSQLIHPETRQIKNDEGEPTTNFGANNIDSFTYTNKAARLLTVQEAGRACSKNFVYGGNIPDSCNWLLENVGMYYKTSGSTGYWLETPKNNNDNYIMATMGYSRIIGSDSVSDLSHYTVRPVITVLTSDLEY